jgi:hypothetical protein
VFRYNNRTALHDGERFHKVMSLIAWQTPHIQRTNGQRHGPNHHEEGRAEASVKRPCPSLFCASLFIFSATTDFGMRKSALMVRSNFSLAFLLSLYSRFISEVYTPYEIQIAQREMKRRKPNANDAPRANLLHENLACLKLCRLNNRTDRAL